MKKQLIEIKLEAILPEEFREVSDKEVQVISMSLSDILFLMVKNLENEE